MRNLTNVLFFRIFRTTVYSTVALTFCAWIVQSSRYLNMLNTNNISLAKFLKFTSYLSIDIIGIILPISLAISAAFVYQRFTESNQLVALQSAGISPQKMLSPLLILTAITTCYLYVSNAYISPVAWQKFRALEFKLKNDIDPPENSGTIFSNNGFSVYAQRYIGDFSFGNIFIIDARTPEKTYSYFASSGTIKNNVLILSKGERIEIDFKTKRNSITNFQTYHCNLKSILKSEKKMAQPNEKFMPELLEENSNKNIETAQLALFHQKISSPLLSIVFSLSAFLLILLAPYDRKPSNFRMIILIATIIVFQGTYFWIANAATKTLWFANLNYAMIFSSLLVLVLIIRKHSQ